MFFIPKNGIGTQEYEKGFKVDILFNTNVTGIVTARDGLVINAEFNILKSNIEKFIDFNYNDQEIRKHFFGNKKGGKYLAGDSRGWNLSTARDKIRNNSHTDFIKKIDYRPFDTRYIYYSPQMVDWGREKYMFHMLKGDNLSLVLGRQSTDAIWSNVQISNNMVDNRYHFSYKGIPSQFPLYLYSSITNQYSTEGQQTRVPNLNPEILKQIAEGLGLEFVPEKETVGEVCFTNSANMRPEFRNRFAPIDLLDYIYAVLHSPSYREKYKEFLKIDFPRVPYPTDADEFWQLVKLGGELRQIHLLKSPVVEKYITQFNIEGDNVVGKPKFVNDLSVMNPALDEETLEPQSKGVVGRVYINENQYFDNVPAVAWNFYIGGYQPAQKWLKDRKERELSMEDIFHYQKIIVALTETSRIMGEIDKIEL
ncbi:MAG: hypothetical protein EOP48_06810 [Sphingobacteriales bacterium]|nr:MAG: hypothetical protein EOP48_06810 [Sphingobacteriales bacterium]